MIAASSQEDMSGRTRLQAYLRQRSAALLSWWQELTLHRQFSLTAAMVLVAGMAAIGCWVAASAVRSVTHNTGAAVALLMESSIAPLVQELTNADQLSQATRTKLDEVLAKPSVADRLIAMNIRRLDGTIVYSRWKDIIGSNFPTSTGFRRATDGHVWAAFDDASGEADESDKRAREISAEVFEIYAPVRDKHSHRVIAVSEFYGHSRDLRDDVSREVTWSWLVVGLVTILMMAGLWGIVLRGSKTITEQRHQLKSQIGELRNLLSQNETLRKRLERSSLSVSEAHERFLRRIGADLHDGPAQLLSYTILRLPLFAKLIRDFGSAKERDELALVKNVLWQTHREIRNIALGLALPELDPLQFQDVIELAISSHELLTGTTVVSDLTNLPTDAPHPLKICVYRFVQEALANAFQHAQGKGQRVVGSGTPQLIIAVSDSGPGLRPDGAVVGRLGLAGLRARIESIGGSLSINSSPQEGTRLTACFDLRRMENEESTKHVVGQENQDRHRG